MSDEGDDDDPAMLLTGMSKQILGEEAIDLNRLKQVPLHLFSLCLRIRINCVFKDDCHTSGRQRRASSSRNAQLTASCHGRSLFRTLTTLSHSPSAQTLTQTRGRWRTLLCAQTLRATLCAEAERPLPCSRPTDESFLPRDKANELTLNPFHALLVHGRWPCAKETSCQ